MDSRLFNQYANYYSDGASDGSYAQDSYSSGDSTHSGEFINLNYMPNVPVSHFSVGQDNLRDAFRCGDTKYNLIEERFPIGSIRGISCNPKARNVSVTSPSPQQVNYKVEPFLHVKPSPWLQQTYVPPNETADDDDIFLESCLNLQSSCCQNKSRFETSNLPPSFCQNKSKFESSQKASLPTHPKRGRPRLSTCDDPTAELQKNGRDVVMDEVDLLRIRLRDNRWRQSMFSGPDDTGHFRDAPLKLRLAQVRAMIRQEIADQTAQNQARGVYNTRRKERDAKKCKFCLKKKEHADVVSHHNLFNSKREVSCPILQQYRCDVCHATGKQAHTIKYCPYNNPDTPHDVILQARLKVFMRNRQE